MKKSTLFWGVFLILSGLFIILDKLSIWSVNFDCVYNYWPLFLIFWGISLLKISGMIKNIMVILSATLLAIFISGFIANGFDSIINCSDDYIVSDKTYSKEYRKAVFQSYEDSIKYAKLSIDAGASNIHIKDKSEDLIAVYSYLPDRFFDFDTDIESEKATINIDFKLNKIFWQKHKSKNRVDIKLNTKPVWVFDYDMGAVNFNADLSFYKVKKIDLDVGASNIKLKLGDFHYRTDVDIDAGASKILIKIPKESYCEINSETGLSSKDFNGFVKENSIYRTENPDNFSNKIYINLQVGVSKFEIVRY